MIKKGFDLFLGAALALILFMYFQPRPEIQITNLQLYVTEEGETRVKYRPVVRSPTHSEWSATLLRQGTQELLCHGSSDRLYTYKTTDPNADPADLSLDEYVGADCPELVVDSGLYEMITTYTPIENNSTPLVYRHQLSVVREEDL